MNHLDFDKFRENVKQMRDAFGVVKDYAITGFKNVPKEIFEKRKNICEACEFWDKNGWGGLGKCEKCGCTGKKLWIAVAECPIQKWGKE